MSATKVYYTYLEVVQLFHHLSSETYKIADGHICQTSKNSSSSDVDESSIALKPPKGTKIFMYNNIISANFHAWIIHNTGTGRQDTGLDAQEYYRPRRVFTDL